MAGVGPQYLRARAPEDNALYSAIIEKAGELRREERQQLAGMIRTEIAAMLK